MGEVVRSPVGLGTRDTARQQLCTHHTAAALASRCPSGTLDFIFLFGTNFTKTQPDQITNKNNNVRALNVLPHPTSIIQQEQHSLSTCLCCQTPTQQNAHAALLPNSHNTTQLPPMDADAAEADPFHSIKAEIEAELQHITTLQARLFSGHGEVAGALNTRLAAAAEQLSALETAVQSMVTAPTTYGLSPAAAFGRQVRREVECLGGFEASALHTAAGAWQGCGVHFPPCNVCRQTQSTPLKQQPHAHRCECMCTVRMLLSADLQTMNDRSRLRRCATP